MISSITGAFAAPLTEAPTILRAAVRILPNRHPVHCSERGPQSSRERRKVAPPRESAATQIERLVTILVDALEPSPARAGR